jgi:hypothetical protein
MVVGARVRDARREAGSPWFPRTVVQGGLRSGKIGKISSSPTTPTTEVCLEP